MPIFFRPASPKPNSRRSLRRLLPAALLCLGLFSLARADAQTLAHPGWDGNFNIEPWYQRAVFYKIDAPANHVDLDFKAITGKLEGLRSLSIDALLLPAPQLPTQAAAADPHAYDHIDDLDNLIHEASRRGIRVLLTLEAASLASDLTGQARFWLAHGVAGLNIVTPPGTDPAESEAIAQAVRRLTSAAVGQRIVLSGFDPANAVAAPASSRRGAAAHSPLTSQLEIDSRLAQMSVQPGSLSAAALRPLLAAPQPNVLLASHEGAPPTPLARVLAAILLTTRPAALIDADDALAIPPDPPAQSVAAEPAVSAAPKPAPAKSAQSPETYAPYNPQASSQSSAKPTQDGYSAYVPYQPNSKASVEIPPPAKLPELSPLATWYRNLASLHHGYAAIRQANITLLDFDAQNALVWIARSPGNSLTKPSLVIACNLSSQPVHLALKQPLQSLGLRGFYLRTILRSDSSLGAQEIDNVTLPPYAVYIGEIHR